MVDVVYSAEQHGEGVFHEGQLWAVFGMGHPLILWSGLRIAHKLHHQPSNTHLVLGPLIASSGEAAFRDDMDMSGERSAQQTCLMISVKRWEKIMGGVGSGNWYRFDKKTTTKSAAASTCAGFAGKAC